jgi:uncharacterized protein YjbI with pentapeptide repeats
MSETGEKKNKNDLKLLGFAVFAVLLASIPAAWNWVDLQKKPLEGTKRQFDASLDFVKTIATIAGGVVLYLNFRVANRSAELAQKKLEQETEKAKVDARLAEARLTMERFSKAVDMMGSDKSIHLRLGGIYALESIALDSSNDKIDENYRQVLEVLTAFVRENAKLKPEKEAMLPSQLIVEVGEQHDEIPPLPTDIQAALTVLGRRKHKDTDWEQYWLNLSKTNLQQAYLSHTNLQQADFSMANLQQAHLDVANLQEAVFQEANLQQAGFYAANLQGTILQKADLRWTDFQEANLQWAYLRGVNLQGADLRLANLQGATLQETYLDPADLHDSILLCTDLRNTKNLTQRQLEGEEPPLAEGDGLPLLCNVALPKEITVNPNRDCDRLPQELLKRYPEQFPSLEEAKMYVDEHRQKKWE